MIEAGARAVLIERLAATEADPAVAVLWDAFHDYPVMRYVLGSARDYDQRLRKLIAFFVMARVEQGEPLLGLYDPEGDLAGAALVTLPGNRPAPESLDAHRESLWAELGQAERERYDECATAWARMAVDTPNHHLNMIGVRRRDSGRGFGRRLLEAVQLMAERDEGSAGVTLTTEAPENLSFYERFGYQIIGTTRVGPDLQTWSFFLPVRHLGG